MPRSQRKTQTSAHDQRILAPTSIILCNGRTVTTWFGRILQTTRTMPSSLREQLASWIARKIQLGKNSDPGADYFRV